MTRKIMAAIGNLVLCMSFLGIGILCCQAVGLVAQRGQGWILSALEAISHGTQ